MFFIRQICGEARKGRSRESFTQRFTAEEAADKLRGGAACRIASCHTWCEHLADGTLTKLYLDRDEVFPHLTDPGKPPSGEDVERHESDVRTHMDALVAGLRRPGGDELTYVVATRHGYSPKHKAHKLSSRPFVQGLYMKFHDIPRVIREFKQEGFWDMTVYKPSEQLLAAINGAKGRMGSVEDWRVLTPQSDQPDPLLYVAQHHDTSWVLLDMVGRPHDAVAVAVATSDPDLPRVTTHSAAVEVEVSEDRDGDDCRMFTSDLVGCLLKSTAADRLEWVKVGHILKREGADRFQLWHDFSASAGPATYKGIEDCRKAWDSFAVDTHNGAPITVASLCFLAERDNMVAYHEAQAAHRARMLLQRPFGDGVVDDERRRDMWNVLRTRFPKDLGGMDGATFSIARADAAGTMAFSDPASGLTGTVSADFVVHITCPPHVVPRFAGLLFLDVVVKGPLSNLHPNIPSEADFVLDRPDQDRATLRSVTPNVDAVVTQYRIGEADTFFKVDVPGKRCANVATRPKMDLLDRRVRSALSEHAAGTPLAWFVNNGVINNGIIIVTDTSDRVRPDYDFLAVLRKGGFTKRVVAVSEQEYYVLNPLSCVWTRGTLGNAAGCLRAMAADGALEVEGDEVKYLKKYDGATRVVKSLLNELQDRAFASKLDSLTPKGCVAMDDGMYDAGSDVFRNFVAEDLVSKTIGYAFSAADSVDADATHTITTFYEQVLPCEAEREYFMRMMAASLFGTGRTKYFLILTDERDGSNGKTTLMRTVEDVFGSLAAATQRSFLNVSTCNDPNQHAANLLAYKGSRLAFFDEPDKDARMDIRRIKDLSSGASRQSGRACGGKEVEEFTWKALIVLACNEANFPVMDVSDRPFLKRMKPLRMRSLFVDTADIPGFEEEAHVFPTLGEDHLETLRGCRSAHLHLLADAYRRYATDGGLGVEPPSVQEVLGIVMQNADPRISEVLDYLDAILDFGPRRKEADKGKKYFAWVSDKDLVNRFWEDNKYALKRNKEKKSDYMLLIRRAMELRGRKVALIQPVDRDTGKQFKVSAYDRVAFRGEVVEGGN